MATKKIQGNELRQLVESLVLEALMEQLPPWMKKALADPKSGAALDAALQKQYAKRKNLPPDEKEKEELDYEVMNLVSATHPTEKERKRMHDIFGEAFEIKKATLAILLRKLGNLIGVTNDFFNEVSPILGDINRGIMLTSEDYGYVMIMPHSKNKGVVNLIPFDVDGEKINGGALVSIKEPEKLLDVAEDLIRDNL